MWYLYTVDLATKKNENFPLGSKRMELENIILSKIWLRRPKNTCSPSYVYYRPQINAVILLDMGHTLRGERAWEEQIKGRKPKTCMWLICSL
jgi:hypothetical protein